jgi:nicotinamidase-related amidase
MFSKSKTATVGELPLPPHYNPKNVVNDTRWIDYAALQQSALDWRRRQNLKAAATDGTKVGVLAIDVQNTFCHPKGELYVAGDSGTGAVDDSVRLVEFLYRNLGIITEVNCTLDTHRAYAVFHSSFLVNDRGGHPAPFTNVSHDDVVQGVWKPSPFMTSALGISLMAAQRHLEDYTRALETAGRYALTIWPYHGMLGDKGHNLVSGLAEVANFHGFARGAQPGFEVKGTHPLVENYSVLGPEVKQLFNGTPVPRNTSFIEKLLKYDILVIAGQAKSHCVAWTIDDLLNDILARDPQLARKVYLLEDCTTSIVVKAPNGSVIYDYGSDADAAFDKFRNAGMHVVQSTDPVQSWPDVRL